TITGTDAVRATTPAGVKAALDLKAPLVHTHTAADVTGIPTPVAGMFIHPPSAAQASASVSVNRLQMCPIIVRNTVTVSHLVTTASPSGPVGTNIVAIYPSQA